jgi:hypothetical protein
MKILKNILLVIALLLVARPCTHAFGHHEVSSYSNVADQIAAVHTCACHSCDEDTVCTESLNVPQTLMVSATPAVFQTTTTPLFILNQSQPAFRRASPPVPALFVGLKTVQLLI